MESDADQQPGDTVPDHECAASEQGHGPPILPLQITGLEVQRRHSLHDVLAMRPGRSKPKMTFWGWLPLLAFVALVAVFSWLAYRWQMQAWLSQLPKARPKILN